MLKIAVTTFYTNSYEPLAAITIPVLQRYCDKHGYFLNINKVPDGNVDFIISRDARELLYDGYDAIMGIETDILITNFNVSIEDFLDGGNDFYICRDVNNINFGCWIATGTHLLSFILAHEGKFKTEQNVLEHFQPKTKVKYLEHPAINSLPYKYYHNYGYINYNGEPMPTLEQGNWERGCFNMHLPGMPLEKRIEIFQNHLKDIIYE